MLTQARWIRKFMTSTSMRAGPGVLAVLLFLLSNPALSAGSLEGFVFDEKTGIKVTGAKVSLVDTEGVILEFAITDDSGNFRLDLGVLDKTELAALPSFFIRVEKDDLKSQKPLGELAQTNDEIFKLPPFRFP